MSTSHRRARGHASPRTHAGPRPHAHGSRPSVCEGLEIRRLLATVSGNVLNDLNDDSVWQSGEPGLWGRTVYVDSNGSGTFTSGEISTSTSSDGSFTLCGLATGCHTIRTVPQASWRQTAPSPGYGNTVWVPSTGYYGMKFLQTQKARVEGFVREDWYDNGIADAGEPGLSGWNVYIDADEDGEYDPGEQSATTNASGAYALGNMAPSVCHQLRAVAPAGQTWRGTNPTAERSAYLSPGEQRTGQDFRVTQRGMITGIVYDDEDADGLRHPDERGVAGRRVFLDADYNGAFDFGEQWRITNSFGRYTFNDQDTGTDYSVRMEPGDGWAVNQKVSDGGTSADYADHHDFHLFNAVAKDASFGETPELSTPWDLTSGFDADGTTVWFNWSHMSDLETGFQIERSVDDGATWVPVGDPIPADATSAYLPNQSQTGGFNGAAPMFRLAAVNAVNGTRSRVTAGINPLAQPRPQNVQVISRWDAAQGRWVVTLKWDHPQGYPNAAYNIYRSFRQGFVPRGPYAIGVTGTTWTDPDPNLRAGQKVYYTVVCVFGGNYSINGGEVQATIPTAVVPGQYTVSKFFYQGNLAFYTESEGVLQTRTPSEVGGMPVDVPAFDPALAGAPLTAVSAKIDWIMNYAWTTNARQFNVSAQIGYSNADVSGPVPWYYRSHSKGNSGNGRVVGGQFRITGSTGPLNPGLDNGIEVWSRLTAWASTAFAPTSGHAGITGRYSGYYTVTYN